MVLSKSDHNGEVIPSDHITGTNSSILRTLENNLGLSMGDLIGDVALLVSCL